MNIINIEKSGTIKANIDEGGLHARQNPDDSAFINIADQAFLRGSLQMKLDKVAELNKGNSGLEAS